MNNHKNRVNKYIMLNNKYRMNKSIMNTNKNRMNKNIMNNHKNRVNTSQLLMTTCWTRCPRVNKSQSAHHR